MQATDQAAMVAALGTISAGLPINNGDSNPIIAEDDNGNAELNGYNGDTAGDIVGFTSVGQACVTAAADGEQLPITRTVGIASVYLEQSFGAGSTVQSICSVTGADTGDAASITFDSGGLPTGSFSNTGGVVVASVYVEAGNVYVTLLNTDLSNTYTYYGNMYVTVTR